MAGRLFIVAYLPVLVLGFDLTLLHTNDVHARVEQMNKYGGQCSDSDVSKDKCYGGFPRLKTKIDELRASQPNTLLLDAGDMFSGTVWFNKFGGFGMATFMNHLGYDAMTLGNHEFVKGDRELLPFLNNVTFPVLSANIRLHSASPLNGKIKKSHVFTFGTEKIGVVGYTTTETPDISNPHQHVSFEEEIAAVQAEVTSLTKQGVNKIIALGHSGIDMDRKVAAAVQGLDVIVGGHNNKFFYNGTAPSNEVPDGLYPEVVTQANGAKVLVVVDYAYAKYLGELRLTFDTNGVVTSWDGNPILLDNNTARDAATLAFLAPYKEQLVNETEVVVGRTHVFLEGYSSVCRNRECNLGNLVADSMVRHNIRYTDTDHWNDVAIAVVNAGSIRSSVAKGDIKQGKAATVLPFSSTIDTVELHGRDLLSVLEHSVSHLGEGNKWGGFLQVSGLKVEYDMKKPNGSRVLRARALCTRCEVPKYEDIKAGDVYKVIMSSFLARGGDHYDVIQTKKVKHYVAGNLDLDIFVSYLKNFSPIIHGEEERIIFREIERPCQPPPSSGASLPSVQTSLWLMMTTLFLMWL